MFRFGASDWLLAYLLVPAVAAFLWFAFARRRRAMEEFGAWPLMQRLADSVSRPARAAKVVLVLVALAALVTALARPQFGTRVETVRREGQDIVVALDLSASMLAEDVAPNRLARAKLGVATLIERLEGDRVGLVAFAGDAFVQSPLTSDYGAAMMFLRAMDPEALPVPGTNLGVALRVALDAFDPEQSAHRVIVLLTDGEDHEGEIDEQLARAGEMGVAVHAVGIGAVDGVPIPAFDANGRRQGFRRDENGEVVTTRLDAATLESIARRANGRYLHATPGSTVLEELAEELVRVEGETDEARQVVQFEERYQLFLGLGLLALLVETVLPERRRAARPKEGDA